MWQRGLERWSWEIKTANQSYSINRDKLHNVWNIFPQYCWVAAQLHSNEKVALQSIVNVTPFPPVLWFLFIDLSFSKENKYKNKRQRIPKPRCSWRNYGESYEGKTRHSWVVVSNLFYRLYHSLPTDTFKVQHYNLQLIFIFHNCVQFLFSNCVPSNGLFY